MTKPAVALILAALVSGATRGVRSSGAYDRLGLRRHIAIRPPVVTIVAREYAFDGPDSIESGPTTFRLVSAGREQHFVGLVRIASPHTFAEYRRTLTSEPAPAWVIGAGGVGTISPGAVATTTLDLEPGLYAMVCDMEDAHGTPHIMEGMLRPLTVLPRRNGASMPVPDLKFVLAEFAFLGPAQVRAGSHVMEVRNVGSQPHMALLWRLLPGKSASTVVHWLDTPSDRSRPPVILVGGVPDLGPGRGAELVVHLRAGRYLLICLVNDVHDHKAHYEKGMLKEFAVLPATVR